MKENESPPTGGKEKDTGECPKYGKTEISDGMVLHNPKIPMILLMGWD